MLEPGAIPRTRRGSAIRLYGRIRDRLDRQQLLAAVSLSLWPRYNGSRPVFCLFQYETDSSITQFIEILRHRRKRVLRTLFKEDKSRG